MPMHPGQLDVPPATARELIHTRFPRWRHHPLQKITATGTVNTIYRIGDRYTARFPLRPQDPATARRQLETEADAARQLLGRTPFPTPEPMGIGEPGAGHPLPWTAQTWIPGTTAADDDPAHSTGFAQDLAAFIQAVRALPTRGRTFHGNGRGGDLTAHDDWMRTCLAQSERLPDAPRLRRLWTRLRELPRDRTPDVMNHGDLIPGNVLVEHGRLTGVLDVGGLGPADPSLDLVAAWHLLDTEPRNLLRNTLGCNDLEWERGKARAFQQAMGAVWYHRRTNPAMSQMGRRTLHRILHAS